MAKEEIPTVPFDPALHVLEGRERVEGRGVFFTLESLVAAERPLEAPQEASALQPVIDSLRAEIADLKSKPSITKDSLIALLAEVLPPPSHSNEVAGALGDLTKLLLEDRGRIDRLESTLRSIEKSLGV